MKFSASKLILLLLILNCIIQYALTKEWIHIPLSLILATTITLIVKVYKHYEGSK